MPKVLIIGVGNILLKDEGIGVHIVHELEKLRLPEGVKVFDGGTGGLSIIDLMKETPRVIFLDAVEMGEKPGTTMRITLQEVKMATDKVNFSLHQVGLPQVLLLASLLGVSPEVVIFGIQPKDLGWGIGLSPELKRAIPEIIESVLREIYKYIYV
jgi:hydrogenase maturation protease